MSAAELERLFQPFSRLARTADATQGFGLGLSITRALVDRMGGAIEVSSHPGRGSTFEVALSRVMQWPAQPRVASSNDAAGQRAVSPRVPASAPGSAFRVLYVEGDSMNRLLAQTILERLNNVDCQIARDGRQALEMIEHQAPDVIICDMDLPDLQGTDLIQRVAQAGLAPHAQWIAVSADSRPALAQRARDAGCVAFWLKPLDIHRVTGMVRELAVGWSMAQGNEVATNSEPRA